MNQPRFIRVLGQGGILRAALICMTGLVAVAEETNTIKVAEATNAPVKTEVVAPAEMPAASTNEIPVVDYKSFSIVNSRNIFSPSRTTPGSTAKAEVKHVPKVDLVTLVGTMSSSKGMVAFFDGSGSGYRGAIKLTNTIAGFTLASIAVDSVKLEAKGKTLMLRVGSQLKREDDGEWQVTETAIPLAKSETNSVKSSSEESSSGGSSGGESDVLKRLLQKREQELNNEKR